MVLLFLADGFEEIEALTQVDYLRRAGVQVKTVSLGDEYVVGTRNITVKADALLSETEYTGDVEMVIMPGGMGCRNALMKNERVASVTKKAAEDGKYVAAICASPTVLAHLGLLKGKKCVCYPGMEEELKAGGGVFTDKAVVTDGNFVTARAAGASEELAFELIRLLKGKAAAEEVKKSICAR